MKLSGYGPSATLCPILLHRDLILKQPGYKYMTTPLKTTAYSTPIFKLEEMFLGLFLRPILVEKEGEYINILSIGDVVRASLLEKDRIIKEPNALASWEYYESWGWDRKKR